MELFGVLCDKDVVLAIKQGLAFGSDKLNLGSYVFLIQQLLNLWNELCWSWVQVLIFVKDYNVLLLWVFWVLL